MAEIITNMPIKDQFVQVWRIDERKRWNIESIHRPFNSYFTINETDVGYTLTFPIRDFESVKLVIPVPEDARTYDASNWARLLSTHYQGDDMTFHLNLGRIDFTWKVGGETLFFATEQKSGQRWEISERATLLKGADEIYLYFDADGMTAAARSMEPKSCPFRAPIGATERFEYYYNNAIERTVKKLPHDLVHDKTQAIQGGMLTGGLASSIRDLEDTFAITLIENPILSLKTCTTGEDVRKKRDAIVDVFLESDMGPKEKNRLIRRLFELSQLQSELYTMKAKIDRV